MNNPYVSHYLRVDNITLLQRLNPNLKVKMKDSVNE